MLGRFFIHVKLPRMKKKKRSPQYTWSLSEKGSYKRLCKTAAAFDMFGKRQQVDASGVVSKGRPKLGEKEHQ